jgi:hypothetical protein
VQAGGDEDGEGKELEDDNGKEEESLEEKAEDEEAACVLR